MELNYEHDGVHAGVAEVEMGQKVYRVTVHYDENSDNPWEEWDGQPPLTSVCGRDFVKDYGGADTPDLSKLTAEQIINNHEAVDLALAPFFESNSVLANDMDLPGDPQSVLEMIFNPDWGQADDPLEIIRGELEYNYITGSMDAEMLDRLEEVWNWLGVTTFRDQVVGYSQGDWCEVLLVATPEWLEKSGVKPEHVDITLERSADLWGHYMFGDVYGATVERLVPNGPDDAEWEEVDSCWGFFGPDHDKSGLNAFVRSALSLDALGV